MSPNEGHIDDDDTVFMRQALLLAEQASLEGEVPVGSVIVHEGVVVGVGRNRREQDHDPLAHAEILAINAASSSLGRWRLSGCTLYVTLEPCFMCAGALVNARVDRLVFGAFDPKAGAVGSLADVCRDPRLNHRLVVDTGLLQDQCSAVLKEFFKARRRPPGAM
ncbi:MAG: tRNA adenosine(34) deaminase TadA [Deltaproteobacteria bacterium]|nr:tRNA adenosine(34) deaminase TadA [Deltaproteobacteria bacterium]